MEAITELYGKLFIFKLSIFVTSCYVQVAEESLHDLMFGNFMDASAAVEEKKYEEISSIDEFLNVANTALEEYNSTHNPQMDIVLFRFALEHLSRVCRVLASAGGCALLVGVGGSGRQSLAKLATAISGHQIFQPDISKNYGESHI